MDGILATEVETLWAERGRPRGSFSKRALDLILVLLAAPIYVPVWLLVAAAIKLDDGGAILYRQRRWGAGGSVFDVFKFRSMIPGSDTRYGITPAMEGDHRVTRVGRLLRATGLDEMPQLLNILRGDMSLVGPRALAVGEILNDHDGRSTSYESIPGFGRRLAVKPGLTGMATIYLPKDAPPLEKLKMDLEYVERRSFLLDIKLIVLSVWISVRGGWEKHGRKF